MTTIPPSATPPPLATTTGPATVSAVLTQVPAGIASASPGTVVTGTIAAVDEQGQAILQTNAGPIVLQTSAALSVGEQISLQLQAGAGTTFKATVLAAEALAAADIAAAAATASTSEEPTAPATGTPATTVAPSVATGPIIVATVIGPAAAPSPPQATIQPASSPPPQSAAAPRPAASLAANAAVPTPSTSPSSAPDRAGLVPISTAPPSTSAPVAGSSLPSASPAPAASTDSTAEVPPPASSATSTVMPPTAPAPQSSPGSSAASAPASVPASDDTGPSSSLPPSASAAPSITATTATGAPVRQLASAIASYTASTSPTGATGLQASASSPATLGSASSLPTPPTGTQVPLRLGGPVTTLASAAASASNGQIVATVVGQTPAGQTIVDTAIGRLAFSAPPMADIAIGQQIALEIAAPAVRPGTETMTGSPALAPGRGVATLGAEWPSLGAALSTLEKLDPALAERVVQSAAAQPNTPRFLGQVLAFLASPAEDVRQLLGQAAVDALQRAGHGDVLNHLDADLRTMNRLNGSATEWQVFYVPLFDSTEARQLRVFTRRHKAGDKRGRDSGGRFIVDVEFEALGPLQLDGLVQKPRLDLILRSHDDLPAALQSGIAEVFGQTCEAAGLEGKIFFQASPTFPVTPLDEMMTSSPSDVSV